MSDTIVCIQGSSGGLGLQEKLNKYTISHTLESVSSSQRRRWKNPRQVCVFYKKKVFSCSFVLNKHNHNSTFLQPKRKIMTIGHGFQRNVLCYDNGIIKTTFTQSAICMFIHNLNVSLSLRLSFLSAFLFPLKLHLTHSFHA